MYTKDCEMAMAQGIETEMPLAALRRLAMSREAGCQSKALEWEARPEGALPYSIKNCGALE
ncbi:MAG: hypothetical protein B6D68_03405 [spirochete symbiont of Stewartia floridana]|nr:MAG: hypothetical protein B6D68_03405 [spirochete symbiont of Stewartia floridana]